MSVKTVNGPGFAGIHPAEIIVKVKASEAMTQYDLCQFDFAAAWNSGTVTDTLPGEEASGFYLVRDPDAEGTSIRTLSCGIFGVVQENIAAGATGRVMLSGITSMNVEAATVAGSCIVPSSSDNRGDVATGGTNLKVVAIALDADTSNIAPVWFNGIHGFGNDVGANVSS